MTDEEVYRTALQERLDRGDDMTVVELEAALAISETRRQKAEAERHELRGDMSILKAAYAEAMSQNAKLRQAVMVARLNVTHERGECECDPNHGPDPCLQCYLLAALGKNEHAEETG